ncbi:hypothetical protein TKK_0007178 [Trichogramma kaykai]
MIDEYPELKGLGSSSGQKSQLQAFSRITPSQEFPMKSAMTTGVGPQHSRPLLNAYEKKDRWRKRKREKTHSKNVQRV